MANGVDHKCSLARTPKEERKPQARTISTRSRHNARHSPLVRTTRWRSNCEADRAPVIGRYTSVSNFLRKPQTKMSPQRANSKEQAKMPVSCQDGQFLERRGLLDQHLATPDRLGACGEYSDPNLCNAILIRSQTRSHFGIAAQQRDQKSCYAHRRPKARIPGVQHE